MTNKVEISREAVDKAWEEYENMDPRQKEVVELIAEINQLMISLGLNLVEVRDNLLKAHEAMEEVQKGQQ